MSLRRSPIKTLPEGYHEVHCLSVSEPAQALRLNLWGCGLIVPFAALMIVWIALVRNWCEAYVSSSHIPALFLWVGVLLALPLHELIHGLAINGVGHHPIYGAKYVHLGRIRLPVLLYTTAGSVFFRRGEFVLVALAPVIVETLAGMTLVVFLSNDLAYYVTLAVILNGSGSIGDLWMVAVVLRFPADLLVLDEADRIRIFVR